ncbi:MAG: hypothetical protein CVV34_01675, partial [Methanomicrobiales archaeon HGW-Methanomicrobiales-5]
TVEMATPTPVMTAPPAAITPVPAATVSAPQVIVTVVHYIVPVKQWKDSELHFTFAAPEDLTVTTRRMIQPDGSEGLMYQTDIVPKDGFFIRTYPISLNQDQAYRDTFRTWDPKPVETTITSNGITFDRFESTQNGKTRVGYVAQKGSANDLGFSSVLDYTTDISRPFEKEDFEKVVASFAYFTKNRADVMSGEEIPRVR